MKWKPLIKAGGPLVTAAMLAGGGYEAAPVAAGGDEPTVIADLNWLTDPGILSMVGAPIENGFYVGTWPWATGGTATSALAIAAGADGGPVYDLTNGVGNDGTGNQALTLPTPVTIPADTDCDIWAKVSRASAGGIFHVLGKHATAGAKLYLSDDNNFELSNGTGTIGNNETYTPVTGVTLLRLGRTAGVWTYIDSRNGAVALTGALANQAISFDTLLAYSSTGSGLDNFSDSGQCIQALRIATYPDGYADRATYRSAYETTINGSPL